MDPAVKDSTALRRHLVKTIFYLKRLHHSRKTTVQISPAQEKILHTDTTVCRHSWMEQTDTKDMEILLHLYKALLQPLQKVWAPRRGFHEEWREDRERR